MTAEIVDRFLRAMLPGFPRDYSPQEREHLMRDTTIDEIWEFRPDLIKR
jgi:hypothetical protein